MWLYPLASSDTDRNDSFSGRYNRNRLSNLSCRRQLLKRQDSLPVLSNNVHINSSNVIVFRPINDGKSHGHVASQNLFHAKHLAYLHQSRNKDSNLMSLGHLQKYANNFKDRFRSEHQLLHLASKNQDTSQRSRSTRNNLDNNVQTSMFAGSSKDRNADWLFLLSLRQFLLKLRDSWLRFKTNVTSSISDENQLTLSGVREDRQFSVSLFLVNLRGWARSETRENNLYSGGAHQILTGSNEEHLYLVGLSLRQFLNLGISLRSSHCESNLEEQKESLTTGNTENSSVMSSALDSTTLATLPQYDNIASNLGESENLLMFGGNSIEHSHSERHQLFSENLLLVGLRRCIRGVYNFRVLLQEKLNVYVGSLIDRQYLLPRHHLLLKHLDSLRLPGRFGSNSVLKGPSLMYAGRFAGGKSSLVLLSCLVHVI